MRRPASATPNKLYEKVQERILSGRMPAGAPIRQDTLAAELGVSKIPLREALTRLESDGLVVSHKNRGFQVRPIAIEEARDIFDLRMRIEPDATALGAQWADAAARAAATGALEALEKALAGASASVGRRNREFHLALVRPSARAITIGMVERLLALSERYVRFHLGGRGRSERALHEHRELLDAWLSGRLARVRANAEEHIRATLRDLAGELSGAE